MKKPMSSKSPKVKAAIEKAFPGTAKAIENKQCPLCLKPITDFKDKVAEEEYSISGLCQRCQDRIYGE
jgi:hypothetical protein